MKKAKEFHWVNCSRCEARFDLLESRGRWQCRIHVYAESQRDLVNEDVNAPEMDSIYPCCQLTFLATTRSARRDFEILSALDQYGCVDADHMEEVTTGGGEDVPRTRRVDDVHILPLLSPTDVAECTIPDQARLHLFNVSYQDILDPSVNTTIHYDVADPRRTVSLDLRTSLKQIIELAYAKEDYMNQPRFSAHVKTALAYRTVKPPFVRATAKPEDIYAYDQLFSPAAAQRLQHNDREYLKLYFMLREPRVLPVAILVVRAAAPTQNTTMLQHVQYARAAKK